ncbi:hypothetical protein HYV70_05850 [Candidatus Uhrbacteria bacterium]|nr:hypothetical protein [Candidatus Uhrbacteria bacterium]
MDLSFISFLISGSLFVAILSGLVALLDRSSRSHFFSQVLLIMSGVLGAVGSMAFLFLSKKNSFDPVAIQQSFSFFGIQTGLTLDFFSALFFALVCIISVLCAIYSLSYLASMRDTYNLSVVDALVAAFVLGMQLVLLSQTPLAFLFGWEVMSITSFFLVMSDRTQTSIRAAVVYLIMTHLGAAAILAGFMLLAGGNPFSTFNDLSLIAGQASHTILLSAFGLFLFGFGSKAGLVPFHIWLPEAHPAAPSHVSALMSGVMLKIALYGFLRVLLFILPPISSAAYLMIVFLGLLSAIFGVLYAVVEKDFKKTLAFSSIENIGLMFTMVGTAFYLKSQGLIPLSELLLNTCLFFAVGHALFKSGLFLVSGAIIHSVHSRSLEMMGGLAKRMPILSVSLCVLILAAAALPPFGPFFAEWVFLQSLVIGVTLASPFVKGILIGTLVITTLVGGLAIFAMVKLFAISMLGEPRTPQAQSAHDPSWLILFPIIALSILVVVLGLFSPRILSLMEIQSPVSFFVSMTSLSAGLGSIKPFFIGLFLVLCVIGVWLFRRVFTDVKNERLFHSWDCGQPIDASMEYTATAFSAPIRFFFRSLLGIRKSIEVHPLCEGNSWIAKRTITLHLRSIWMDFGYTPLGKVLIEINERVKKIQNGNIRFYLFLLLLTLLLTIWIAL